MVQPYVDEEILLRYNFCYFSVSSFTILCNIAYSIFATRNIRILSVFVHFETDLSASRVIRLVNVISNNCYDIVESDPRRIDADLSIVRRVNRLESGLRD